MLDTVRTLIANQFEASLCTLNVCIDRCPDSHWHERVANHRYCQLVFHTLFYADYYLGPTEDSFRDHSFHRENAAYFRDYEELQDRIPELTYDRDTTKSYVQHCRNRALQIIAAESAESLAAPCGFQRRPFSRAELYIYNIRHIQHHSAQLSLRLRLDLAIDVPWISYGWRDV